jgi:orotate phosphoribosyltransferase
LVADYLQLPFGYVRSEAKKHGMGKQIEGAIKPGQKVLVIEDLVSTGKSSLQAVHTLREFGCDVQGMASIFTYGFDAAQQAFDEAGCSYFSLSNYDTLITVAVEKGLINANQMDMLASWRRAPEIWGK